MYPNDATAEQDFTFARYPVNANEPYEFIRKAHGTSVSKLWYPSNGLLEYSNMGDDMVDLVSDVNTLDSGINIL